MAAYAPARPVVKLADDVLAAEIKRARWKNYRLRYFTEELEEINNAQTETHPD